MLKIEHVSYCYDKKKALFDVGFEADQGQCIGVIGANGAGKTTLLRVISGIASPSSGKVIFGDQNIYSAKNLSIRRQFGVAIDDQILVPELSGQDFLQLCGLAYGLKKTNALERSKIAFSLLFEDEALIHSSIKNYSKGMKQKILLISTLLHSPKMIVLDEPFSGLDPWSVEQMIVFLNYLKNNKLLIISSHDLVYLSRICTHILYIENGKQCYFKTLDEALNGSVSLEELILKERQPDYSFESISWL